MSCSARRIDDIEPLDSRNSLATVTAVLLLYRRLKVWDMAFVIEVVGKGDAGVERMLALSPRLATSLSRIMVCSFLFQACPEKLTTFH
jgi:hypothetical protein